MTFNLIDTPAHLGLGGTARPLDDFGWTPEQLTAYAEMAAPDGRDGRLVSMYHMAEDWTSWEQHPLGHELVIVCTGKFRFIQDVDGAERVATLGPGEALINPPGVWHTADIEEPGLAVFITPGVGTEHRDR